MDPIDRDKTISLTCQIKCNLTDWLILNYAKEHIPLTEKLSNGILVTNHWNEYNCEYDVIKQCRYKIWQNHTSRIFFSLVSLADLFNHLISRIDYSFHATVASSSCQSTQCFPWETTVEGMGRILVWILTNIILFITMYLNILASEFHIYIYIYVVNAKRKTNIPIVNCEICAYFAVCGVWL